MASASLPWRRQKELREGQIVPPVYAQDSPRSHVLAFSGGSPWLQAALGCLSRTPLLHSALSLHAPEPEGGLGIPSAFPLAGPRPHLALLSLHALASWAQLSLLRPSLDTER